MTSKETLTQEFGLLGVRELFKTWKYLISWNTWRRHSLGRYMLHSNNMNGTVIHICEQKYNNITCTFQNCTDEG